MKADTVTPRTDSANKAAPPVEAGGVVSKVVATTDHSKQFTSAPVEPGAVGSPEFIRVGDARRLFGLGRTYCYSLIAEGKIRSVCLRKRGAKTGVRLLDVASVREFIRREMERGANGASE